MASYPPVRYSYYVTVILLFAYAVSYIDRQILSLMIEPIKNELQLSDTQFSLLQGLAFAIFYTALGLFFGRIADRRNRRNLIIYGILIWSCATAAGGLATGFFTLFLARVFVGVGEASLSPSAYSMLADYFPHQRRARAMSLYSLGVYLGSALALIVGGAVVQATKSAGAWKSAFYIVSIPGFIAALLLLTVREPERQHDAMHELLEAPPDLTYLKQNARVFVPMILGYSVISIVTLGLMAWIPATFIRTWHWAVFDIGYTYGLIILVFGLLGMLVSGFIADTYVSRGQAHGAFQVSLWGTLALIPLTALFAFSTHALLAIVALSGITFVLGFPIALAPAVYQTVTPNRLRGQVIALYLLANNIIGMTLGPTAVALFTNLVLQDEKKVGLSLGLVCFVASLGGTLLLWFARRPYLKLLSSSSAMSSARSPTN